MLWPWIFQFKSFLFYLVKGFVCFDHTGITEVAVLIEPRDALIKTSKLESSSASISC